MSKILITGAAGFIGSQLAYRLWKDKNEIVLIDNFSYGSKDNLIFEDVDFQNIILNIDVRDKKSIDDLYEREKFDYIYHIAGITPLPDCQVDPAEAVAVNVMGTVNILEAGRKYGVKKIIFASTSAVYENNIDFPSTEEYVIPPSLIYPNTKYTAERYCQAYADTYGMSIVCMRFANVYGPHIDCLRKQPPVIGYLIREYYYDRQPILHSTGEQRRDFVYVDDLIELALKVQEGTGYDVVNVSTNTTHTINELAEIVAGLMGKDNIHPLYVSSSHYWEKYPELYQGAYPISKDKLEQEVVKFTQLSNEHAYQRYGWKPVVDLKEGIEKTMEFSLKILNNQSNNIL